MGRTCRIISPGQATSYIYYTTHHRGEYYCSLLTSHLSDGVSRFVNISGEILSFTLFGLTRVLHRPSWSIDHHGFPSERLFRFVRQHEGGGAGGNIASKIYAMNHLLATQSSISPLRCTPAVCPGPTILGYPNSRTTTTSENGYYCIHTHTYIHTHILSMSTLFFRKVHTPWKPVLGNCRECRFVISNREHPPGICDWVDPFSAE